MKSLKFNTIARYVTCAFIGLNYSACLADGTKTISNKTKLENFSESTCPANDFDAFFKIFAENESVQKKYTYPSVVSMWVEVDGVPEPTPFLETKSKDQLSFPLMPKASERKSRQLYFQPAENGSVTLAGENTGYHVRYIFLRASCWYLIGIEDMSI